MAEYERGGQAESVGIWECGACPVFMSARYRWQVPCCDAAIRLRGHTRVPYQSNPSKHTTVVLHLYNVGPTSETLGRRCTNVIQIFSICWDSTDGFPANTSRWLDAALMLDQRRRRDPAFKQYCVNDSITSRGRMGRTLPFPNWSAYDNLRVGPAPRTLWDLFTCHWNISNFYSDRYIIFRSVLCVKTILTSEIMRGSTWATSMCGECVKTFLGWVWLIYRKGSIPQ